MLQRDAFGEPLASCYDDHTVQRQEFLIQREGQEPRLLWAGGEAEWHTDPPWFVQPNVSFIVSAPANLHVILRAYDASGALVAEVDQPWQAKAGRAYAFSYSWLAASQAWLDDPAYAAGPYKAVTPHTEACATDPACCRLWYVGASEYDPDSACFDDRRAMFIATAGTKIAEVQEEVDRRLAPFCGYHWDAPPPPDEGQGPEDLDEPRRTQFRLDAPEPGLMFGIMVRLFTGTDGEPPMPFFAGGQCVY